MPNGGWSAAGTFSSLDYEELLEVYLPTEEILRRDRERSAQLRDLADQMQRNGRRVITDGTYIYDISGAQPRVIDLNGTEMQDMMRDLDQKSPEGQRQAVLDMPQIRYELLDTLLHLLNNEPKVMQREFVTYQSTLGDEHFEHNYQRDRAANKKMADVFYKGKRLCRVQRFPHQRATIYRQNQPKLRLIQRTLERLFYDQLPKVKVEVI